MDVEEVKGVDVLCYQMWDYLALRVFQSKCTDMDCGWRGEVVVSGWLLVVCCVSIGAQASCS